MSGLPEGWALMPLGTISTRTKNVDPSKHPEELFELFSVPSFATGGPEYLKGAEIGSTKQEVEPDDILLCKIVPHINRVWVVPPTKQHRQIGSGEWIVYRNHFCEPHYLRYALTEESFRDQFLATSSGVGGSLTRARPEAVSKIEIPVAPLAEQKRIVAKVDGLTARTARARTDLARIPTLIARYKQRLLALAFSGELTAGWRAEAKLPAPQFMSIDSIADGLRYGTAQKCYEEPKGIAVLRIPNVASGRISLDDLKFAELESKELAKLVLREGDILIVRSNGSAELVGRPALVTGKAVGLAYAGYLIRVRPDQSVVSPKFLTFMLEAPNIRKVIEDGARSTSGVHNVNAKELGALQIPIFHLAEQTEVTRRVESAFNWLDHIAADHATVAKLVPKLDAAILAKAFRGELVPQDPADEPARELLARIKATNAETPAKGRRKRTETSKMPKELKPDLLTDSLSWPAEGLAFDVISNRLSLPYEQLKDAVFAALGGDNPELVQTFDADSRSIRLRRAKP